MLQSIELLDLLELSGTTAAAAQVLGISQPSASRRSRQLAHELGLPAPSAAPPGALRYGQSRCLQLLRRACQAHRLEAGACRLGVSPWLEVELRQHHFGGSIPGRFREPAAWLELVAAHTLDGALLSGLDLQLLLPELSAAGADGLLWRGCRLLPIATAPLGLLLPPAQAGPPERWSPVAVPAQSLAPGLASLVRQQQWQCLHAPHSCQTPRAWGQWLRQHLCPLLAIPAWATRLRAHLPSWHWQPWPGDVEEQHWLLVLENLWHNDPALPRLLTELRTYLAADAVAASPDQSIGGQRSNPPSAPG